MMRLLFVFVFLLGLVSCGEEKKSTEIELKCGPKASLAFYETMYLSDPEIADKWTAADKLSKEIFDPENKTKKSLSDLIKPDGAFGTVKPDDKKLVDEILNRKKIISVFDGIGIKFMWSKLNKISQKGEMGYFLHACKIPASGKADVEGKHIQTASTVYNGENGKVTISLNMTSEGSNKWYNMTSNNVGKAIAITMDDIVYSTLQILGPVNGGNIEIDAGFSTDTGEAEKLACRLNK